MPLVMPVTHTEKKGTKLGANMTSISCILNCHRLRTRSFCTSCTGCHAKTLANLLSHNIQLLYKRQGNGLVSSCTAANQKQAIPPKEQHWGGDMLVAQ